jgi:hypothetical protein
MRVQLFFKIFLLILVLTLESTLALPLFSIFFFLQVLRHWQFSKKILAVFFFSILLGHFYLLSISWFFAFFVLLLFLKKWLAKKYPFFRFLDLLTLVFLELYIFFFAGLHFQFFIFLQMLIFSLLFYKKNFKRYEK